MDRPRVFLFFFTCKMEYLILDLHVQVLWKQILTWPPPINKQSFFLGNQVKFG
jgi:hypothetical protein